MAHAPEVAQPRAHLTVVVKVHRLLLAHDHGAMLLMMVLMTMAHRLVAQEHCMTMAHRLVAQDPQVLVHDHSSPRLDLSQLALKKVMRVCIYVAFGARHFF